MSAPQTPSERAHLVGKAQAKFDAIRVDYPPQTSAMAILDEVRIAGLYRDPDVPCGGAMIVAPTGAGKTETIKGLRRVLSANAAEGEIPLLHVEIDKAGTTDSVPTSILKALGAARPEAGSEKTRWPRAIDEIVARRVELIVFDEFDLAAKRPTMSGPIATGIRQQIMDAAIAPVVFVGSEAADTVFSQVPALRERLDDSADLSPMRWNMPGDQDLFLKFVSNLDRAMVDADLVKCETGFASDAFAHPLWQASGGRLRPICKIARHAMSSVIREGRDYIDGNDLALAVDTLPIDDKSCSRNPFLTGEG